MSLRPTWNSSRRISLQPEFFQGRTRRTPGLAPIIESSVPRSGRGVFAHYPEQLGGGAYRMTSTYRRPRMDQGSATTHRLHSTCSQSLGSECSDLTAVTPRTGRLRYHLRPVSLRDQYSHRLYLYPCYGPHVHASPVPCTLMNNVDLPYNLVLQRRLSKYRSNTASTRRAASTRSNRRCSCSSS